MLRYGMSIAHLDFRGLSNVEDKRDILELGKVITTPFIGLSFFGIY